MFARSPALSIPGCSSFDFPIPTLFFVRPITRSPDQPILSFARRPDHLRRARGYFVNLIPPQRATNPSPVPHRLVKAPVAGHPLPKGEGSSVKSHARQRGQPSPRAEGSFDSSRAHQRGQPSPRGEGGDPAGAGEPGEGCLAIPADLAGTPHQVFAPLVQRDRFWYIYKLSA